MVKIKIVKPNSLFKKTAIYNYLINSKQLDKGYFMFHLLKTYQNKLIKYSK